MLLLLLVKLLVKFAKLVMLGYCAGACLAPGAPAAPGAAPGAAAPPPPPPGGGGGPR